MRILFPFLLLLVVLLTSCNREAVSLPGLQLQTLDGEAISTEFKDEVVFLHFWATWCPPCRKEMPSIVDAANKLADTDLRFLMVSEEKEKTIENFVDEYMLPMEFVQSTKNIKLYGVIYIPQTYIVKNGKIIASFSKEQDWATEENLELLRSYLK